jgi:phosphatidate cytidylyltransferase
MDCQFIMGFFSYMYYQSFIAVNHRASVGGILETAITSLSPEEQVEVLERLGRYLVGQGIIKDKVKAAALDNL